MDNATRTRGKRDTIVRLAERATLVGSSQDDISVAQQEVQVLAPWRAGIASDT
jgi:hypothetical protein